MRFGVEMTGERDRSSRWGRLPVAAAVVAVGIGTLLMVDRVVALFDEAPAPVAEREAGQHAPFDGAVWLGPDGLRLAGSAFEDVPEDRMPTNVALVAHGVVFGMPDRSVYQQSFGQPSVRIGRGSALGPVGDSRGATAAWFEDRDLVVFDTEAGKEVARARVAHCPTRGSDPFDAHPILAVSSSRVVFEIAGEVWALDWTEDSTPHRLGAPADTMVDAADGVAVLAGRPVTDHGSGGPSLTRLMFAAHGRTAPSELPVFTEGLLSADGRYFAASTGYDRGHRLVVLDVSTGRTVPVPHVVVAPRATPYKWSYGDALLVRSRAGAAPDGQARERTLYCDVSVGRCGTLVDGAPWSLIPD